MQLSVEIDAGQVSFHLENLQGEIAFHEFIDFRRRLTSLERLLNLKKSDPNHSLNDLFELQKIHQTIKELPIHGTEAEKIAVQYWLASLFLFYFRMYQLDREDSPCRRAWVHLLKLRCNSLLILYTLSKKGSGAPEVDLPREEDIRKQLPLALREWRTFCQEPQNHFWFRQEYGLGSPEEEILQIIHGEDATRREPNAFFLQTSQGREVLRRRFISEWFLNDRYTWFSAFRLCYHYWKSEPKLKLMALSVLLAVPIFLPTIWVFLSSVGYFQAFQLCLFSFAAVIIIIAFVSESFMELLVPRLWTGVAVGYVPVLITEEIWKTTLSISSILTISCVVVSLILALLYLRWEIGNRMRQTPDIKLDIPLRRALVLLIVGVIAALFIGLITLDSVGKLLIEVYFSDDISKSILSKEYGFQGIFSKIYIKMLLIFASIALLLGVILQIFWQEKPVTASV